MRRINVNPEGQHRVAWTADSMFGCAAADFNRAAHPPVIESTPACAEEGVDPRLVKVSVTSVTLPGINIHRLHIHLTDSKAMHDIIRCEVQMKWLADFRF